MRRYIDIVEKYSEENSFLLRSLGDEDFDYYQYWWAVCQWAKRNHKFDEFSQIAGEEITSSDQLNDCEPDLFAKLPMDDQKEAAEWVMHYIAQHDPADLPSNHFFHPDPKLLPRDTWLVHFSDHADQIIHHGFTHGSHDSRNLGLTTYYKHDSKKDGGYNFAFEATSRYAASGSKYGRNAVMFQNSGVKAWHNSDEEDQVIFWGPDVNKRDLVLLRCEYGEWLVVSRDGKTLFKGDFEPVVKWVIANHQQYRRAIFGN